MVKVAWLVAWLAQHRKQWINFRKRVQRHTWTYTHTHTHTNTRTQLHLILDITYTHTCYQPPIHRTIISRRLRFLQFRKRRPLASVAWAVRRHDLSTFDRTGRHFDSSLDHLCWSLFLQCRFIISLIISLVHLFAVSTFELTFELSVWSYLQSRLKAIRKQIQKLRDYTTFVLLKRRLSTLSPSKQSITVRQCTRLKTWS